MPPEAFEEGTLVRLWRSCSEDVANTTLAVNSIENPLFCGIDGHKKVPVGMVLVYQDARSPGRQPLLNTDCFCHANRHIAHPRFSCKTHRLVRAIVSTGNNTVPNHRSPEKLHCRELLFRRKLCHPQGLRETCHHATPRGVGRLFYPAAECQACPLDEVK